MHRILKHRQYWIYGLAGALTLAIIAGAASAWSGRTTLDSLRAELTAAQGLISELQEQLRNVEAERDSAHELLRKASEENAAFGKRVEELASSVNFLDKLSKTDRELLQKYSSVYFLSENFIPDPLVPIDDELLAKNGSMMIHGDILPYLRSMMREANADGAPLLILSAYRSFGEQSAVKSNYKLTYGAGTANKFSADQGYSEHQLGSTVDFVTPENPTSLTTSFSTTPQYQWLLEHAHEYGFILSYPEGNTHFQFEPWHWRFVGVDLARYLHNDGKHFYDLDQREINAYLARIFD